MKETLQKLSKPWGITVSWVATILVPVLLLFIGIRLLASEYFLDLEYHRASFPADTYGFSVQERLEYANLCIRYLTSEEDISLLAETQFADGSPVFNERELSHMEDVKTIFQPVINLGFGLSLVLFGFLLLAQRRSWRPKMLAGIRRGGWVAVGLVGLIGILAAVGFQNFFEQFHAIFFQGDSWIFLYSDTLIRLFPMKFWQDAVLFLLLFTGGLGLLLGLLLRLRQKPTAK